jgi:hypothetical protein
MARVIAIFLLTICCAWGKELAPVDTPYNKVFDPWRACTHAKELAKRGAPDALRTLFLAAYVRVNQPFLGGEDLESMDLIFGEVLQAVGDRVFSHALKAQRPEVRSAAKWFLGTDSHPYLKKFPRTAKLLSEAPKMEWPLDKAYRED